MKRKAALQQAVVLCCGLLFIMALFLPPNLSLAEDMAPKATVEELFKAGKFDERDTKHYNSFQPEIQTKILTYFALGQANNLNQKQLRRLARDLVEYYYLLQAAIDFVSKNDPTLKPPFGSAWAYGDSIENLIPQVGTIFSDKGKQLDAVITRIMTDNIRKSDDNIRKSEETIRILNETLEILKQIQKSF